MISPEIWESQNFSSLSDLAKIVFISLFSHADDEGRGVAKPSYITNITFPYDENRRVADIKKALLEIALRMSTQFYSVNGNEYYAMSNWKRWQKIDKPSKSKLPPPPKMGEGGDILNSDQFDEHSANTPRTFDEPSPNKDNKNKNITSTLSPPYIPPKGENEEMEKFLKANPQIEIDGYNGTLSEIDFKKLSEIIEGNDFLKSITSLSWICKNYRKIISGYYKPFKKQESRKDKTNEIIDRLLAEEYAKEQNNDG